MMLARILFSCFLVLLLAGKACALPRVIEVYRNGVFIVEEFEVKEGENTLPLLARISLEEIEFLSREGAPKLVNISLTEVEPEGELFNRLKELREREKELAAREKELLAELTLLEEGIKHSQEALPAAEFEKYLALRERLNAEREKVQKERVALKEEINKLSARVSGEKVSALLVWAAEGGRLWVRYPAPRWLTFKDHYTFCLETSQKSLKIAPQFLVTQKSGRVLGPLELRFYPRSRAVGAVAPPPFSPWVISEGLVPPPRVLLGKAASALKKLKPPRVEREVAGSAYWERLSIKRVRLVPGRNVIPLPVETLAVDRVTLEVPLYAVCAAYFRADFTPDRSLPRLSAQLYLDGSFVGRAWLGPFSPGQKARIYFGVAELIEVKQEVLKDITGDSFWGKEVQEKVTRTTIINHYPRRVFVEVRDRIPVSHRKEIKIEAEADPPWDKRKPDGEVSWAFFLAPEEKKTLVLSIKIKRPSQKD